MALETNITLNSGIVVEDAYCRVENATVTKQTSSFVLAIYADKNKPVVLQKHFLMEYSLEGENPIKQAYLYLKTLPGFEGAEDC